MTQWTYYFLHISNSSLHLKSLNFMDFLEQYLCPIFCWVFSQKMKLSSFYLILRFLAFMSFIVLFGTDILSSHSPNFVKLYLWEIHTDQLNFPCFSLYSFFFIWKIRDFSFFSYLQKSYRYLGFFLNSSSANELMTTCAIVIRILLGSEFWAFWNLNFHICQIILMVLSS